MVAVILLLVVLLLIVAFLVGYLARQSSETNEAAEVFDPEQEMKAALELHRIRRNLDVAWTKSEQRRAGAALRRDIKKALEDEE